MTNRERVRRLESRTGATDAMSPAEIDVAVARYEGAMASEPDAAGLPDAEAYRRLLTGTPTDRQRQWMFTEPMDLIL